MREFMEYVRIYIHNASEADLENLDAHLSMNGYNFGMDKERKLLFVFFEEADYIETILTDRNFRFGVEEY